MAAEPDSGTINRDFWENDLQISIDPWLEQARSSYFVERWLAGLTKRQLQVLRSNLGSDGDETTLAEKRRALAGSNGELTPYILVYRFAYRRATFAIANYADRVMGGELETFRTGENKYDLLAILFALYRRDPAHLKTVYHLEKVDSTGFARMKLKGKVRLPAKQTFHDFITANDSPVPAILEAFDAKKRDRRASEFKEVVSDADRDLVFIRREELPSMVLKARRAFHGFRPEWIVLDFHDNGRRVDIGSHSMTVPLDIANKIMSAYVGAPCVYENEIQITYKQQILAFFEMLKGDADKYFKLAEIAVRNSPLDEAPLLDIGASGTNSIAKSVRHFEQAVGPVMNNPDLIRSLKVLYSKKRIKLTFEPRAEVADGYVVRYTDSVLNPKERKAFEAIIRKKPYGIRILSSEKRGRKQ